MFRQSSESLANLWNSVSLDGSAIEGNPAAVYDPIGGNASGGAVESL